MFLVESKLTSDQQVKASIKTITYLKGPLWGFMGPQMSPCILCKKDGDSYAILEKGRVINFPHKHGVNKGYPNELSIIFLNIVVIQS